MLIVWILIKGFVIIKTKKCNLHHLVVNSNYIHPSKMTSVYPGNKFSKWPKAAAVQLSFPIQLAPPVKRPFPSLPSTMFVFTIFLVTRIDHFPIGSSGNQPSHSKRTRNGLVVLNSFKISNFLRHRFSLNLLPTVNISSPPELINHNFVYLNWRKCQWNSTDTPTPKPFPLKY